MAVKPLHLPLILLIVIITCAGAYFGLRQKTSGGRAADDRKFISTYISLAIAGEYFAADPDSFNLYSRRIYAKYRADSTWMRDFAGRLARDAARSRRIWQDITTGLDSLGNEPRPLSDFD